MLPRPITETIRWPGSSVPTLRSPPMVPVVTPGRRRRIGRVDPGKPWDQHEAGTSMAPVSSSGIDRVAGMGKTTLWRRGVTNAAERGWRVLSTRPAESEAKLSYAGLAGLFAASGQELEALPDPQRNALEVA